MTKQGHSLVELLVVMGMTSVVFSVGIGMVHRVMHEQKHMERENSMHRVAERLSSKLREDIHGADETTLVHSANNVEQLVLQQPNQRTVTYTVSNHVLNREASRANEQTHRDTFPFPDNYRLEFAEVVGQRVTFTVFAVPRIESAPGPGQSPSERGESQTRRAVMQVKAYLGRNHRFSTNTRKRGEP